MPQRRQLDCRSAADVIADVERLERAGYDCCGQWNLTQVADHLTRVMQNALEGPQPQATFFLRLVGPLVKTFIFKSRKMRAGFDAATPFLPQPEKDDAATISRLKEMARRVEAYDGPWQPHFIFGAMTAAQWKDLQWIHSAHHLSFLIPRQ